MMLIQTVESRLGSLENWPTSISRIIFTYDPHMLNASKKLEIAIAFFFGNDIPLQTACQFFIACNGHTFPQVKEQFRHLYDIWSRPVRSSPVYKCHYYNMHEGKYKYVDGSYMYEFNRPSISPKSGFSGTGFPTITRTTLRLVCQMELEE